jgi:hypothetical protein
LDFLHRHARVLLCGSAIVLAAAEVYVDWGTWIQLNVLHRATGLPLVLAALARNRRLIWILALMLFMATFAVYASSNTAGIVRAARALLREPRSGQSHTASFRLIAARAERRGRRTGSAAHRG